MLTLVKTTRRTGIDDPSDEGRPGTESAVRLCSTYRQFWPLYLRLHATPACRAMHYAGTCAALVGIGLFAGTGRVTLLAAGIVGAYGLAWIGHILFEGNRPATFSRPLWSLWSDVRMVWLALSGRLAAEIEKIERIDEKPNGSIA